MDKNPVSQGGLTTRFIGIGPVTRGMVHGRAGELALIAGRALSHVSKADIEQAKRELSGEVDLDRQAARLELIPETKRWDPVPGSVGHQTPETARGDEDDEGRSETELLVDEGFKEAGHDQMLQAARKTVEQF